MILGVLRLLLDFLSVAGSGSASGSESESEAWIRGSGIHTKMSTLQDSNKKQAWTYLVLELLGPGLLCLLLVDELHQHALVLINHHNLHAPILNYSFLIV